MAEGHLGRPGILQALGHVTGLATRTKWHASRRGLLLLLRKIARWRRAADPRVRGVVAMLEGRILAVARVQLVKTQKDA